MKEFDRLFKRIGRQKKPFLEPVINVDYDLEAIDRIGRYVYTQDASVDENLAELDTLKEWYQKSPEYWRVLRKKEKIIGYCHIELLDQHLGEKLISGKISENEIATCHIVPFCEARENSIIHIGSIVRDKFDLRPSNDIARLLAGASEMIFALSNLHPTIKKIVAVSYPDKNGKNHFDSFLEYIGFEKVGNTPDGDYIYLSHINSCKRGFLKLREVSAYKNPKPSIIKQLKASGITFDDILEKANKVAEILRSARRANKSGDDNSE